MDSEETHPSPIWALAEPVRRALYRYIVGRGGDEISRSEAADALGIPPHAAKFHLDRLESEGLLSSRYRRPDGRSGPGAGRPTKWYRRSDVELTVSLPERRYELVGEVMAAALDAAAGSGLDVGPVVTAAAEAHGRAVGQEAASLEDALADAGYEPQVTEDGMELANCPFHRLSDEHTDLVCGINHAFIGGVIAGAGDAAEYRPRLRPMPGRCCVVLDRISHDDEGRSGSPGTQERETTQRRSER